MEADFEEFPNSDGAIGDALSGLHATKVSYAYAGYLLCTCRNAGNPHFLHGRNSDYLLVWLCQAW